jgi:hypothetical protein
VDWAPSAIVESFSWTNAKTNEEWSTDVMLESDGFGGYYGVIRNDPFVKPVGHKDGFTVGVRSPSTFEK